MKEGIVHYGGVPVPWTVSWSLEDRYHLDYCPHAGGRLAICQTQCIGEGKPRFSDPNMNRQRAAIAKGLCDLCARPLKLATKVSLSQARPQMHAVSPGDVLQVEPLLHRRCAAICLQHCPALKRQAEAGILHIRQVTRWQPQFALYSEQGVFEVCGERRKAVSYAKVQLIRWVDRDVAWLEASA